MNQVYRRELRKEYINSRRKKKRCTPEILERILRSPPPIIERIDELEIWQLDEHGNRKRRICGCHRRLHLPSIVPEGFANPHGVVNPYEQYRCTMRAGKGVPHLPGLGPCAYHATSHLRNRENAEAYIRAKLLKGKCPGDVAVGTSDLNDKMAEVMASMTVDELLDGTRLLFRLEALRQMAEEDMAENEFHLERADAIANMLGRMVDMRLKMAKTDSEIIKNQAIAQVLRVVLNGVVAIVEEQLGKAAATGVLQEFREKLLVPLSENGFSEMLKRQEAAGLGGRIEISPTDIRVEDLKQLEQKYPQ